jgi:polyvinyl alcohol dehydrogenase (cytochrome)
VLHFRGSITAVRVRDGSVAWKTYLVDAPVKTGTTAAGTDTFGPSVPRLVGATVDAARGVLYITTGDNYSIRATATSDAVMALDLKSGKVVWSRQTTPNDVYNSACGGRGPNCPPNNGPDFDFGSSAMLVRTAGGRDVIVAGRSRGGLRSRPGRSWPHPVADARRRGRHQRGRAMGHGQ